MEGHLAFVATAYGMSGLVVVAMIVWILRDHRTLTRAIADLEAQGVRRRSAQEKHP